MALSLEIKLDLVTRQFTWTPGIDDANIPGVIAQRLVTKLPRWPQPTMLQKKKKVFTLYKKKCAICKSILVGYEIDCRCPNWLELHFKCKNAFHSLQCKNACQVQSYVNTYLHKPLYSITCKSGMHPSKLAQDLFVNRTQNSMRVDHICVKPPQ